MNITRKLFEVGVKPQVGDFQNVVARVRWGLEFERGGFTSVAYIETMLDISDLSGFTPVDQLTKKQIIQWAYDAQDGDQIIADQTPHHDQVLAYESLQASIVEYKDFPTDATPSRNTVPEIPQEIL
jgi:hypothetical protein